MRRRSFNILVGLAAAVTLSASARALTPDDIAVIFNTSSPNSLKVARHYMSARNIPATHLIPVTVEVGEFISEEKYRTVFVRQVAKALADRKLDGEAGGIKCLVTTYDVPLRIQAREATAEEKAEIAGFQKLHDEVVADMERQIAAYDRIAALPVAAAAPAVVPEDAPRVRPEIAPPPAPQTPATQATTQPATAPAKPTWRALVPLLNTAAGAVGGRIEKLPQAQQTAAVQEFIKVQEHVAGLTGLVNSLQVSPNAPVDDPGRKRLNDLSTQLRDLEQQYAGLVKQQESARIRKEIVAVRTKAQGLVGEVQAIEGLMTYLQPTETEASLDSELALVLADQTYGRSRWLDNPMTVENFPLVYRLRQTNGKVPRSLMVARLDGSTPDKVIEMIDTSLKVEAAGLEGKMYLDARGLRGTDAYAIFDADLRRAGEWLKQHSTMEVVLEDTPALLQAKDAPEAALYCGWYSLNNYQESGEWVKGAVGYHVASYEMGSLHNPKETGWVVNLLNRGFCGTLGATDEPYLTSFPKPSQFFPLLLSGAFTQGEVWQVTSPMLSWRLGFVGDPLYNPFKVKPRVKVEDLKADTVLRNAFQILGK